MGLGPGAFTNYFFYLKAKVKSVDMFYPGDPRHSHIGRKERRFLDGPTIFPLLTVVLGMSAFFFPEVLLLDVYIVSFFWSIRTYCLYKENL